MQSQKLNKDLIVLYAGSSDRFPIARTIQKMDTMERLMENHQHNVIVAVVSNRRPLNKSEGITRYYTFIFQCSN